MARKAANIPQLLYVELVGVKKKSVTTTLVDVAHPRKRGGKRGR